MQVDPEAAPQIPWIVLTSDATDSPTRAFFEKRDYFGLDVSQVKPFQSFQEDHGLVHPSMFFSRSRSLFVGCEHANIVLEIAVTSMLHEDLKRLFQLVSTSKLHDLNSCLNSYNHRRKLSPAELEIVGSFCVWNLSHLTFG